MRKIVGFLDFTDKATTAGAIRALLAGPAGPLGHALEAVTRMTVNPVFQPPENRPRRAYENTASTRNYDVVVEVWTDRAEAAVRSDAALSSILDRYPGVLDLYAVEERVVVDRLDGTVSGQTSGIKYIGRHLFHEDLPLSAVRRSWSLHGELAVRMFTKLGKYVQNVVVECLTAGSPKATGIPQLYFDSLADFSDMPPGGQEQIVHDLKHLVQSGVRLYTVEHVIAARSIPQKGAAGA